MMEIPSMAWFAKFLTRQLYVAHKARIDQMVLDVEAAKSVNRKIESGTKDFDTAVLLGNQLSMMLTMLRRARSSVWWAVWWWFRTEREYESTQRLAYENTVKLDSSAVFYLDIRADDSETGTSVDVSVGILLERKYHADLLKVINESLDFKITGERIAHLALVMKEVVTSQRPNRCD